MFSSFEDFWPYYLRQHARKETRHMHFIGTALAALGLVAFVITWDWRFPLVSLPLAYALSWIGHVREGNAPATFTFPVWSFRGDIRMFRYWLAGRLSGELHRAGVADQ
ncbi:MAG: DUF962 domain-containing protein [Hyphomicrobium sp.]